MQRGCAFRIASMTMKPELESGRFRSDSRISNCAFCISASASASVPADVTSKPNFASTRASVKRMLASSSTNKIRVFRHPCLAIGVLGTPFGGDHIPYPLGRLLSKAARQEAAFRYTRQDRMPNPNSLRILIADDHEVVRRGLTALLSSRRGWIVCAEASTGRDAVALAEQHRPDIVVMDISMPGLNGVEATRKIRKVLPKTQVVILSIHYSDQLVREIVDSGARAYILKSDASRELLAAVEAVTSSRSFFTSSAGRILIDGFCDTPSSPQPSLLRKSLSAREREIVQPQGSPKSGQRGSPENRPRISPGH
jgi:DNA-binding NarL/FixJ family response regulator